MLISGLTTQVDLSVSEPQDSVERSGWLGPLGFLPWAAAVLLAIVGWVLLQGPAWTIDPQLTLANQNGRVTHSVHSERVR